MDTSKVEKLKSERLREHEAGCRAEERRRVEQAEREKARAAAELASPERKEAELSARIRQALADSMLGEHDRIMAERDLLATPIRSTNPEERDDAIPKFRTLCAQACDLACFLIPRVGRLPRLVRSQGFGTGRSVLGIDPRTEHGRPWPYSRPWQPIERELLEEEAAAEKNARVA